MYYSYEKFFGFILKGLLVIWAMVCVFVSFGLSYLIFNSPTWCIPAVMLGVMVGVISSSYIYVVFSIPYLLSKEFDVIKNRVALNEYATVDEFQREVADFIIQFFQFAGANIQGGVFEFKNCQPLMKNVSVDCNEVAKFQTLASDISVRKINLGKKSAYLVPVELKNVHLGYMVLISKGYSFPFFKNILIDFENYYLDDQLMHVVNQTGNNH